MSSSPAPSDRDAHVAAHSYKYDEATDSFVPSSYRWPKETPMKVKFWTRWDSLRWRIGHLIGWFA